MENLFMNTIMVSILCNTYNHKTYIEQCINGFLNQKVNFDFEIIIRDDASTDGTTEIVRKYAEKYPSIIFPHYYSENQYSKGNAREVNRKMFDCARGKYIALCEGDDFWISDSKLQKQVDFLESNPEYVCCGHAAYYANEDGTLKSNIRFDVFQKTQDLSMNDLILNWAFATSSILYKKSARTDYNIPFRGKCKNGDYSFLLYIRTKGKIYYINECMSAYRIESIGSVNWKWRKDKDSLIRNQYRFLEMLDLFDEYTRFQHNEAVNKKKEKVQFAIFCLQGNLKEVRKNRLEYNRLTNRAKLKLLAHYYFPFTKQFFKSMTYLKCWVVEKKHVLQCVFRKAEK